MHRDQRINEILYYWRDIAASNPTLAFGTDSSSNHIYHDLIYRGVPARDRRVDISVEESRVHPNYLINAEFQSPYAYPGSTFNNWIQYYARSNKSDVFINPSWSYFCQFISKDRKAVNATDHLKVYIPLDSSHVEDGAKMIFNFLEDNNISHNSKIGKRIRFDNIVVRLINPNDLDKLADFVQNNSYIQEGLLPSNPFAFQHKGIALAIDGKLSYNETVCEMIDLYINYKRQTNSLNSVDVNDFYDYIERLYFARFANPTTLTAESNTLNGLFIRKVEEKQEKRGQKLSYEEANQLVENYRQVIQLICKSHRPGFSYNDYLKHYAENIHHTHLDEHMVLETNRMLIEALETMTRRFSSAEDGYRNVRSFYEVGESTLITRENNLRYRMIDFNFRAKLKMILDSKGMNFDNYTRMVLNQYHIDLVELERSLNQ